MSDHDRSEHQGEGAGNGSMGSDAEMRAFVAGWFARARNPKEDPLLVEDAWHAYRLIESARPH